MPSIAYRVKSSLHSISCSGPNRSHRSSICVETSIMSSNIFLMPIGPNTGMSNRCATPQA